MDDEDNVAMPPNRHQMGLGDGRGVVNWGVPGAPRTRSTTVPEELQVYPKKRLVICCDGTWNTDDLDGRALTNVARIARCISDVDNWEDPKAPVKRNFISQIVYYQPGIGIGTGKMANGWDALTGRGLSKTIRQAYSFICLNRSTTGDTEVVLIGFSRGAFTVRCVAQFMQEVGLLTKSGLRHLPKLFKLWKRVGICDESDENWKRLSEHKSELVDWEELTTYETDPAAVRIHACAVWDTVSAVGIPMLGQIRQLPQKKFRTVNGTIPRNVRRAIQALSLDERRRRYKPMIWDRVSPTSESGQELVQCWFAGNHSDVGGGNKDITLANLALAWMIGQLTDNIQFDQDSLWVTTTTRAWSKPSPTGDTDMELQKRERFCRVVATSPVTQALCTLTQAVRSNISWGSRFQRILGGARPRQRHRDEVHYSVYIFHQLGIANYEQHLLLKETADKNDSTTLIEAVRAAIVPLSKKKQLKFEGDILARWAKHELCAHVNIRQARTTAEVIPDTVLRSDTGRLKLEELLKTPGPAEYSAAVPISTILSAIHSLSEASNKLVVTDSTSVHALDDFCNRKVEGKPKKAKNGQTLGTFTFSIVDSKSNEKELVVSSGQLTFTRTFNLLMGRAHNITDWQRASGSPNGIPPCPKCQKIWSSKHTPAQNRIMTFMTNLVSETKGTTGNTVLEPA